MSRTLANTYYIKALDNYPYDLAEFMEAIDYALSYDEQNSDIHCLMGQFYSEQTSNYTLAKHHFELALTYQVDHLSTYKHFIGLCILIKDYTHAAKLINYAQQIPGINEAYLFHQKALIAEKEQNLKRAKKLLKQALLLSTSNNQIDFLKNEKSRVKEKMNVKKKKKKKN